MPLVVQHDDVRVIVRALEQGVGADRAVDAHSVAPRGFQRGNDQPIFLVSERVRVDPADGDFRPFAPQFFQSDIDGAEGFQHPLPGDHRQAAPQARVQRDVRNPDLAACVLEAQHQDAVLGRQAGGARDERRIAVELDAGGADRGLGVRCRHDRGELSGERAADRGLRRVERGAAMHRGNLADLQLPGVELLSVENRNVSQGQTASSRMRFQRAAIADDDRTADRPHFRVERRLERDLRADAARVAGGDRDARGHFQGSREAWITSGTPWPPTDLMARSTSLSPKRWVVILSSGKRFDASCCRASSQAL